MKIELAKQSFLSRGLRLHATTLTSAKQTRSIEKHERAIAPKICILCSSTRQLRLRCKPKTTARLQTPNWRHEQLTITNGIQQVNVESSGVTGQRANALDVAPLATFTPRTEPRYHLERKEHTFGCTLSYNANANAEGATKTQ